MQSEYTVTMVRPDVDGRTTRTLRLEQPASVVSDRQLAGYLTHVLFSDEERAAHQAMRNVHFTIEAREGTNLHVFTVYRSAHRHYLHS